MSREIFGPSNFDHDPVVVPAVCQKHASLKLMKCFPIIQLGSTPTEPRDGSSKVLRANLFDIIQKSLIGSPIIFPIGDNRGVSPIGFTLQGLLTSFEMKQLLTNVLFLIGSVFYDVDKSDM